MFRFSTSRSLRNGWIVSAAGLSLFFVGVLSAPGSGLSQEAAPAAIATDRSTSTDHSQSMKPEDLAMTRKIREEIAKDRSLSQDAKNVEIETVNGSVTIKGLVRTSAEKWKLLAQAGAVAGSAKVTDQIQVAGQ